MLFRPKNRIFGVFLLFICLCFLSVSANAADTRNSVDAAKQTLTPVTAPSAAELRMPFTVVKDSADGRYPVYLELTGLPADTECWVEGTMGDSTDTGMLTSDGGPAGLWLRFDGKNATVSARVAIYAEEQKETLLYEPVLVKLSLVESLAYSAADAAAAVKEETVSMLEREAAFTLVLPKNEITEGQNLQAVLLDHARQVCGHSQEVRVVSEDLLVEDSRYDEVFKGENPYRILAQQAEFIVSFHRVLELGSYTLYVLDEEQNELCVYADLLTCSGQPAVEVMSWSPSLTANRPNGKVASVRLRLVGGDPADISLELWQDNDRLGASEGYCVADVYGWQLGSAVDYEIPLNEPLDENAEYWVKVVCGQPVLGEIEVELSRFSTREQVIESQTDCLENGLFASFVIPADGFVHNRQYQLQLLEDRRVKATKLASPTEKGWFDVGFTSANGTPLPLQDGCCYQVIIACWTPDGWRQCASTKPVLYSLPQYHVQPSFPVQKVDVSSSCVDLTPEGTWKVTLQGNEEDLLPLEDAKLRLIASDGMERQLSPQKAAYGYFDRCLTLTYQHPESADYSWYDCSLLLDGKALADSEGALLLAFDCTGCYKDTRTQALGQDTTTGMLYYGVDVSGKEPSPVALELYDSNGNVKTVQWSAGDQPVLGAGSIPTAVGRKPVQAVVFDDGIPVLMLRNSHWFPRETALDLANGVMESCLVNITCEGNGQAMLYCNGQPTEAESLPPLSEIYVHTVPAEGYVVESIQVNQAAIDGRSFLLTEDTQVDVVFRKDTPERFALALEYDGALHDPKGGSVSVSVDLAKVEDVITLTAAVQQGYVLDRLDVIMEDSGTAVILTPAEGCWQFPMPAEPVRIVAAIRPLYQPVIGVQINNLYGSVTAPESAVEGQNVIITAVPHPASQLERLELVYTHGDKEKRIDLLPSVQGDNCYSFLVPAADNLSLQADFAQPPVYTILRDVSGQGTVTASTDVSIPTETITLTVAPSEGYRLVKDALQVQTVKNGVPQTLLLESGEEGYRFCMPWGDVTVSAAFEAIPPAAPGGVVTTQTELFAALGGSGNAFLAEDGCTVRLIQSAELQQPLVFRGGALKLDAGQFILTTGPEMAGEALNVEAGAALHITGTAAGGITAEGTAIHICGGTLTVEGGSVSGATALELSASGSLHLRGGSFAGTEAALQLNCPVGDCLDTFVVACHPETGVQYDDAWAAQTTVAGAVRFLQAQPSFASDHAVANADVPNLYTVTADIVNPTGDSLLLAALYGEKGQLRDVTFWSCARGDKAQVVTLSCSDTVCSGRVFLLDKTTFRPLAQDIPIEIQ